MALVRESSVKRLRSRPAVGPVLPAARAATRRRRAAARTIPSATRTITPVSRAAHHPTAQRPAAHRTAVRWSSAAVRWLWGSVALAVGMFIAGGGMLAWAAVAATTLIGLVGLVRGRRWAPTVLWIGVGLCLGVCLHLALELTAAERSGLVAIVG